MPASRSRAPRRRASSSVWATSPESPSSWAEGVAHSPRGGEAHHAPALRVGSHEERPARAATGQRLGVRGEARELLRAGDVARARGGGVALKKDEAADPHIADEGAQLLVALDLGAPNPTSRRSPRARGSPVRGVARGAPASRRRRR